MDEKEQTKFFHFRIGNLEVARPCSPSSRVLEVRQWDKSFSFHWIIAAWEEHNDGPFLKFVGKRPLADSVSPDDFWTLARAGQEFLDKEQQCKD
jgi:hypothetical protein